MSNRPNKGLFFHVHDNLDLPRRNLTPLSASIAADVATKQWRALCPASGVASTAAPCPFICVITSQRAWIRHTVQVTPLPGMRPLKTLKEYTKGWEGVVCVFLWEAGVRIATCKRKHCWQLSIVIKSHVTEPGVDRLGSSGELKVMWVWVYVRAWTAAKETAALCVGAPATPGSPRCHSQSQFVTGVWHAPQETARCADTDKDVFFKCFPERKKKKTWKSPSTHFKFTGKHVKTRKFGEHSCCYHLCKH